MSTNMLSKIILRELKYTSIISFYTIHLSNNCKLCIWKVYCRETRSLLDWKAGNGQKTGSDAVLISSGNDSRLIFSSCTRTHEILRCRLEKLSAIGSKLCRHHAPLPPHYVVSSICGLSLVYMHWVSIVGWRLIARDGYYTYYRTSCTLEYCCLAYPLYYYRRIRSLPESLAKLVTLCSSISPGR